MKGKGRERRERGREGGKQGGEERERDTRKREAEKGLFLNQLGSSRILLYFPGAEKSRKWISCVMKSHPQTATPP